MARLYSRPLGPCPDTMPRPARRERATPASRSPETPPLISSLGAMARISLRRSRADWPIVLAAGLICLLAATLLAAGSIYAERGLDRRPPPRAAMTPRPMRPTSPSRFEHSPPTRTRPTRRSPRRSGRRLGRSVERSPGIARSESFALPDQPAGEVRDLAVLGYAEGLADHATLVDGAWPAPDGSAGPAIPVALSEAVAASLRLAVGDRLPLQSRTRRRASSRRSRSSASSGSTTRSRPAGGTSRR